MGAELHDLIVDLVVQAVAAADSALSTLFALYSAGMQNGLDAGPLAAGAAAGGAAGAATASGGLGGDGAGGVSTVARAAAGSSPTVPPSLLRFPRPVPFSGPPLDRLLPSYRTLIRWSEEMNSWMFPDHALQQTGTTTSSGKA